MIKKFGFLALMVIWRGAYAASVPDGYLFVTFRGEATPMTEQVYFMLSENGYDWKALNKGEPVLVSTVGEKGVRDPYIIRSHDNTRFYLIATDLSINLNRDWGRAQSAASKSIVIWESGDLVNWSEPRLVKVAPDNAGCTWAPEAVYDEKRGEYMLFWASKTADDNFSKQRIWAARTQDFRAFSKPFVYIEKPTTVIDTTIIRENENYYRFTKDEKHKAITLETSRDLMDGWREVSDFSLARMTGYEGPACFMMKPAGDGIPARWCLLLDWYSQGRGYQPYETDDLGKGQFSEGCRMNFPFHPVRHGTVMPVSAEEMNRLAKRWGSPESRNPVLTGHYADPDIIYSRKTGRYYIYPTSDGFDGWSGTYFKAFSSDNPAGPFTDSGKPLIDFKPACVRGGQEIDPDVFHDPVSGRDFLYWGNGYMAVAELNPDMVSIKRDTLKVMTPDKTFREGAHVLYRKGLYYFLWSEDDTRSPNYRVRYAVAKSPTGPLEIPENNLVIAKDEASGIYGTGHNSTIQVPGSDEWYIVYHRFCHPEGIKMGQAAGYHREVCIDRLEFDEQGFIVRALPTHKGVGQ
jgi:arabinoxylan arabinofuranohydrolase